MRHPRFVAAERGLPASAATPLQFVRWRKWLILTAGQKALREGALAGILLTQVSQQPPALFRSPRGARADILASMSGGGNFM